MGIKSLCQTLKKNAPNSIHHENLYKLSGNKVAVDASLIIYQQLLNTPNGNMFRNKGGKITNHITGLFYKIMNYISLNIELVFIFDGKPPDNKNDCINERKEKSMKAKELSKTATTEEERLKLERASIRLTGEMINDVKHLLNLLGISYIHPEVGEGEAFASELCRMGYVDYVLTEDMDTMAYGCPKLIRNCIDRSLKRKDVVSIFTYETILKHMKLTEEQFLNFCILCGCDYCPMIPKVGPVTALQLVKQYNTIDEIIEGKKQYKYPENYRELFLNAKENFYIFKDKIDLNQYTIHSSERNTDELYNYLTNYIEMNPKRVENTFKKFHNNYKK